MAGKGTRAPRSGSPDELTPRAIIAPDPVRPLNQPLSRTMRRIEFKDRMAGGAVKPAAEPGKFRVYDTRGNLEKIVEGVKAALSLARKLRGL